TPADTTGPYVWPLTARDTTALRDQARRLHHHLTTHTTHPADVAHALTTTRTTFDHRAAVIADNHNDLLTALTHLADNTPHPNTITGTATTNTGPVYLYSGQGSQRPTMGAQLYKTFPAYAQAIDNITDAFTPHLPHPLRDILHAQPGTPHAELLHTTQYAQPAIFALGTALTHLLTTRNITPTAVLGHSIGAYAAAHTAGILTLTDATTLVATRANLMQQAPTNGTMTAIQATPQEAQTAIEAIDGHQHLVSIAAINSATSIVISGDTTTVNTITNHFHNQGRRTKQLTVSHAFHSPHMDTVLDQFLTTASQITYHQPTIPFISDLTGQLATHQELTNPHYWTNHIRNTVQYHQALTTTHTLTNTTTYLELGATPTLTPPTRETLDNTTVLPLLRNNDNEPHHLTTTLTTTWTTGTT
ncbi:acyltransferase domain-containing protein, partial [Kitasatospora sp. NPDC057223]|uniref:acyltransferase domain-containing protein n=1 Tax=Kitasatospora sp. NPDC057223 TaxID=3346055 RepID=UPI00362DB933